MMKELKNSFMQAMVGTTVWLTLLITLFANYQGIGFLFFWKILGISGLFAFVFGVIYPYLWNYSTFKARTNILISTCLNSFCGLLGVYLYSAEMFAYIQGYILAIIGVTLVGHVIGFYGYSNYENKKMMKVLNESLR